MKPFVQELRRLNACSAARKWAATQPSAQTGWDACERGDWMLWLAGRLSGEPGSDGRRKLVLAACECARLTLPRIHAGEDRPRLAVEAAEDWARGGATTLVQVRSAYTAAFAAAAAANACADTYTYAAAYAAASSVAYAYAAFAADAAAYAAYAKPDTLRACADIARKHYPECPIKD